MAMSERGATAADTLRLSQVPFILTYHRVAEVAENALCVTQGRFAEQMAWLKRHGLRGVGVGTLVDAMRAGRHHGLVGITFDDGYASLMEGALPTLLRHGFTATMFIVSGLLDGTNEWDPPPAWRLMSAEHVRELATAGMEIGSHTVTHLRLAGADADQLKAEVSDSRTSLRDLIGTAIRGFAYPYGSMDAAAQQAVRDAGYDYACATNPPINELGLMTLPRMFIAECDGDIRMTAKRLLFRPYFAVHGGRP
jgi:peptidoglycan/xylan/chitin deacetylase (PgdA/CDA1 family)